MELIIGGLLLALALGLIVYVVLTQAAQYGNLHHAIEAGVMTRRDATGELGDLAAGRLAGRERPEEITIADLTGVGVQDAAIAETVVEALGL